MQLMHEVSSWTGISFLVRGAEQVNNKHKHIKKVERAPVDSPRTRG